MIIGYVLGAVLLVVVFWLVGSYNSFIRLTNQLKEATSDIDVQLKRRYDLIPNLVSTVKGYAAHEQGTFEKVIAARNAAMAAPAGQAKVKAENELSQTLKSIFALAESYPDLKANQNFLELQRELTDTEDKIQAARRFFNGVGRDLNIKVESFPSNMIAKMFNFSRVDLFDAKAEEKEAVKVQF
jgi:LemA protein